MGFWERWRQRLDAAGGSAPPAEPSGADGIASPKRTLPPARPPEPEIPRTPATPPPRTVTRERLLASMRRHRYHVLTDERGDLCGLWGYRFFSFHLHEERIFQVRGRWTRLGNIERLWELLEICEGWNRRNPYPKCYVRVQDDGRVHVLTETAVPIKSGLTDTQIDNHLQIGLAAGTAVFDELDRRYPDPVTTVPNE